MQFTLVTTVRNEGPYLWEWVAHHRMIGFDNIIVFQNDSDDGTDAILRLMQAQGLVRYFYNRAGPGKHQINAYFRAARREEYLAADYVMALDLDEFLIVHAGAGHLQDFMAAVPEFDCAHINWRIFGCGGHATMPRGLVTESFLKAEYAQKVVSRHSAFKTLFRRDRFTRPGIHKPFRRDAGDLPPPVVINGSGLPEGRFDIRNFQSKDPQKMRLAQVNHYMVRDAASFVLKSARGSAHQAERQIRAKYWQMRNINQEEDRAAADRAPALRAEMARIDAICGGEVSRLSAVSQRLHRRRFRSLMQDPDYKALYDTCLQTLSGLERPRSAPPQTDMARMAAPAEA